MLVLLRKATVSFRPRPKSPTPPSNPYSARRIDIPTENNDLQQSIGVRTPLAHGLVLELYCLLASGMP